MIHARALMLIRIVLPVLVVTAVQPGCGAPVPASPAPTRPRATPPADQGTVSVLDDVTGATWREFVDGLPRDRWWAVTEGLLREGNFECPRRFWVCGNEMVDDAHFDETIEDPCLRRQVVEHLLTHRQHAPLPDRVVDAALDMASWEKGELIEMIMAGAFLSDDQRIQLAVELELLGGAPDIAGIDEDLLADAIRRFHLGAAVRYLPASEQHADLLHAVVADPTFPAEARADAMLSLETLSRSREGDNRRLVDLAAALVDDADCRLAAKASEVLWSLTGQTKHLPRRPATRDRVRMLRALCVLAYYEGENYEDLAMTFVPPAGLRVEFPFGYPKNGDEWPADREPEGWVNNESYEVRNVLRDWLRIGVALADPSQACTGRYGRWIDEPHPCDALILRGG